MVLVPIIIIIGYEGAVGVWHSVTAYTGRHGWF